MRQIFLLFIALALPCAAGAEGVQSGNILPGWQDRDGTHITALDLVLLPGWKTYWRAPGSAGVPPVFDWSGSQNVASVAPIWPRPQVFRTDDGFSIGYHGSLVLPLRVTAVDPALPVVLQARVTLGVCKDICMPVTLDLGAALAGRGQIDPQIESALNAAPITAAAAGVTQVICDSIPIDDGIRLTARIAIPDAAPDDLVVVEPQDPTIWVSDATMTHQSGSLTAVLDLVPKNAQPFQPDGPTMRITVLGASRAVDIQGCR